MSGSMNPCLCLRDHWMDNVAKSNIDFFFAKPSMSQEAHRRGDQFSVLYLLRQELLQTQGYDPFIDDEFDACKSGARTRLFASLSLIFTGLDLLAKFEQGDGGGTGQRYKAFLRSSNGCQLDEHASELVYSVRNSLLHGFGEPDEEALSKVKGTRTTMKQVAIVRRVKRWGAMDIGSTFIQSNGPFAEVFVDGLYHLLLLTIQRYRESLDEDTDLVVRFQRMFDKYGTIVIRYV